MTIVTRSGNQSRQVSLDRPRGYQDKQCHYRDGGGHNGDFDFPASGDHDWSSWGPQLAAMSGDLAGTIK